MTMGKAFIVQRTKNLPAKEKRDNEAREEFRGLKAQPFDTSWESTNSSMQLKEGGTFRIKLHERYTIIKLYMLAW